MDKTNDFRTQYGYMLADKNGTDLSASMEDYVEMIYRLSSDAIRVNNLAAHLHVTPSAVSRMAEQLKQRGLIEFERYGFITLTDEGKRTGAFLLWRHDTVKRLLERINGEDSKLSEIEQIEHFLSPVTVKNIEIFLDGQKTQ
ncbi:MAG: metal-dependent transcriptional regulator [Clostridia bacterium]|nr:metal-dependent transcriptional regulator [Clostridia bacterium]MBQ8850782.1 metal-dependent transcriptional regulator [Clostridia bacterium]